MQHKCQERLPGTEMDQAVELSPRERGERSIAWIRENENRKGTPSGILKSTV